uniref:Retrotransposon gag domain-containing protein n=1 Tax=Tanacetum cinerariifolium TaxID=118510 RepID=A0A699GKJ6_TANCI|nr:hypothetical protein [Tanacetum cinerariifolium]
MRTHSSSNLPVESSSNPSTSNPKRRNRRRSKQPFILEESLVDTIADQRTMAELLRAPIEGYAEVIVVPSILAEQFKIKHRLINMMTSDQFFGLEKDNPHDHICCRPRIFEFCAGGNLLERRTQDVLTIIENKSKIAKLTHVVNQKTSAVTTSMTAILKEFQATPPLASVKAVEEICVTYGGAHPHYQCLPAGGNTFPELRDNIQGYVAAAVVNYNQDYILASLNYFPTSPGNTSCDSSNNSSGLKRGHKRSSSSTSALPQAFEIGESYHKMSLERHEEQIEKILNRREELTLDRIKHMEDRIEARAQIVGLQRKQMRRNDKIVLACFRISTLELIIKDIQMPPKKTSTSLAPTMTQAAIQQLVADSVVAALETQAANMENTNNTNRNIGPRETPIARKCTYKEFMSCQPFYFNGTKRAVSLIHWFERNESVFFCSNCTEDCKVKFATVKKMEDEFYSLIVKGNDLKTYARRFQELALLCPNMVSNAEKLMEAFIRGLPRDIEGNVTALKPQTLEEAITITQRLMDQVTKHDAEQGTNDHKRNFNDRRKNNNNYLNNCDNNNYPNDRNNNNYQNNRNNNNNRDNYYHQQPNKRKETVRTYTATSTENKRYTKKKVHWKPSFVYKMHPASHRILHCQESDLQQSGSSDQGL